MANSLLKGKVALVTGAGRGIGSSIARLFAAEGATVAVHYHKSEKPAKDLADEIGGQSFQADLADPAQASRLVGDVIAEFGRVNILVNNAASFTHGKLVEEDTWQSYTSEMDGVFGATFHVTHAVISHMKAAGHGRIINFGATLLHRPAARNGPHAAAKGAVVAFSNTLARELGPHGITVNVIHPGMTLTNYSNALPESQREKIANQTPLRRLANPEDVAKIALFYASDLADFVTGAEIAPDGGLATL